MSLGGDGVTIGIGFHRNVDGADDCVLDAFFFRKREFDALHAACRFAAHESHIVFGEADCLTLGGDEHEIISALREQHIQKRIAFSNINSDNSAAVDVGVILQCAVRFTIPRLVTKVR